MGGLVHRLEERHEGLGLLRRRPAAAAAGLPWCAVADGCAARADSAVGCPVACRASSARRRRRRASGSCSPSRAAINLLAAARIFLFGARDVWFVVGLPVFLYANGWSFMEVGGFLAAGPSATVSCRRRRLAWSARSADGLSREVPAARLWSLVLAAIPLVLALAACNRRLCRGLILSWSRAWRLFGVVFAVNSSLHSYLILAYAGSEKAAEDVGFYYAANATGRLDGNTPLRPPLPRAA